MVRSRFLLEGGPSVPGVVLPDRFDIRNFFPEEQYKRIGENFKNHREVPEGLVLDDLRAALRQQRKAPGVTTTAIVTLTL